MLCIFQSLHGGLKGYQPQNTAHSFATNCESLGVFDPQNTRHWHTPTNVFYAERLGKRRDLCGRVPVNLQHYCAIRCEMKS